MKAVKAASSTVGLPAPVEASVVAASTVFDSAAIAEVQVAPSACTAVVMKPATATLFCRVRSSVLPVAAPEITLRMNWPTAAGLPILASNCAVQYARPAEFGSSVEQVRIDLIDESLDVGDGGAARRKKRIIRLRFELNRKRGRRPRKGHRPGRYLVLPVLRTCRIARA